MSMVKFKKLVLVVLWVYVVLVVCYIFFIVFNLCLSFFFDMNVNFMLVIGKFFFIIFVYFNFLLNFIVYCWRVIEVREIVKNMLMKFFCMLR